MSLFSLRTAEMVSGGTNSSSPIPERLPGEQSQNSGSPEGERQWAFTETEEVQTAAKEKSFPPGGQPGSGARALNHF